MIYSRFHNSFVICVLSMLLFAFCAHGNIISYAYDASGNRVSRSLVSAPQRVARTAPVVQHSAVEVFPTVTDGDVTVMINTDSMEQSLSYSITSLQGALLKEGGINEQVSHLSFDFVPGIYILTIRSDSDVCTFKIIKR